MARRSAPMRVAAAAACASVAAGAAPEFWPRYGGLRSVQTLDGVWQFGFHHFDAMDPSFDPRPPSLTPRSAVVPSTMDAAAPGILGRRGVGVFRTTFRQEGAARLQFMACAFYCRVFVDGQLLGDHLAGGYVPFDLDLPAAGRVGAPVDRELLVLADNRFNSTTAPMHTGGDFWHFGGILRSVLLHKLPDDGGVWPWRAYVFPRPEALGDVAINITVSTGSFSGQVPYSLQFDGGDTVEGQLSVVDGVGAIPHISVPKPRAWSLGSPEMHTVAVDIGGGRVVERFGLRSWGVDTATSRITLNGEVVRLHGWNHHQQWPEGSGGKIGATPSAKQLDEDIALLLEGGANYVRGGHYPQDQRWLDRLDEKGFAMWEETLGPGVSVPNLNDWTYYMKYQLQQIDEMMLQSLNHPSIMTWGFFNEGPSSDPAACPGYAAAAARVQGLDPSRFVTYATNSQLNDKCLEHATLISFNYYPAWYDSVGDLDAPARAWNHYADGVRSRFPGVPFVISETGAGGIYEWTSNDTVVKWTLKYQSEVLGADVDVAMSNGNISGVTLWHFFDFKGNDWDTKRCGQCDLVPGSDPPLCGWVDVRCGRPGGLNHKGVVDPWRRKKPAFDVVAAKYKAAAFFVV